MKRIVKNLRKRLWESFEGCDCPPTAEKENKCTAEAVRCNGRLGRVYRNFKWYGLAAGFGSADGDGLDPAASAAAVERRTRVLREMGATARQLAELTATRPVA